MDLVGIPLFIADFVFYKRYATSRYTLPSVLGIQLAVAYLLTTKLTFISTSFGKKLWSLVTFMLITSGIISCALNSQAQVWWNKLPEKYQEYPEIAKIISQGKKPLLITDVIMRT